MPADAGPSIIAGKLFSSQAGRIDQTPAGRRRRFQACPTPQPPPIRCPSGCRDQVAMKLLPLAFALLALAGCGTFSVPGTVETATSLNGFRASHGLSQL